MAYRITKYRPWNVRFVIRCYLDENFAFGVAIEILNQPLK